MGDNDEHAAKIEQDATHCVASGVPVERYRHHRRREQGRGHLRLARPRRHGADDHHSVIKVEIPASVCAGTHTGSIMVGIAQTP